MSRFEEHVRSTRLDSGVTVVTEHMPSSLSVTTGVWVNVGSRDEAPEQAGCSHFLEHLLFKGTDTRSALDIAQAIDAVGGEMNAYTTKEYTTFYTRTVAEDAALSLDILCDIISRPALRHDEVDSERQVILEEIAMRADDPSDLVHDVIHESLFPAHGLGRDTAGTSDTVAATSREHIEDFLDSTYTYDSIVVAVAGAVDHDATVQQVSDQLRRPPSEGIEKRDLPVGATVSCVVVEDDTEQAHVVIAFPGMTRDDPDRFAMSVLDHVLGGGMSSRLFHEIREKRGLAYSVYSYRASYADAGFIGIYAGTAPKRTVEVLDVIAAELDRLRTYGLTDEELRRAKGSVRGATALSLEDSGARMSRIGRGQLLMGEITPVEDLLARTEAVESTDIHRVIERFLSGPACLAAVGPIQMADISGHPLLSAPTR
jgi:predicted Zn-dependent peptidase